MSAIFAKMNLRDQPEILVLNAPASFEAELALLDAVKVLRTHERLSQVHFALAFVTREAEVDALAEALGPKAQGDALLWFAFPKGSSRTYKSQISRDHGWDSLGRIGFEIVRLVAIDQDWSAARFRRVEFIRNLNRKPSRMRTAEGKACALRQ